MARREIQKGPGKFDLMLALFEGGNIVFQTASGKVRFPFGLEQLRAEDASRASWLFEGHATGSPGGGVRCQGLYRPSRGTGWIDIED
ncbi:MAG: hypothetical protein HYW80_00460 [Parcubacteria group bacterium]|nr:hypothetical protein [Parcubacteria group bacterium]